MKKKSEKILARTLFSSRPAVGEYQLEPLTAGRILLLEKKGNALFGDLKAGDEVESYHVMEAFFVCKSTGDELADLMEDEDEWKRAVRSFAFDCPDEALLKFWEVIEEEKAAIAEAKAVPKKKRARKASRK